MYTHSVILESSKCIGCTDCIKRCPTEAIRVRDGKATIIEERCIDCGNCIAICRNGAKQAKTDTLAELKDYPYKVAMPAPSFYAQFRKIDKVAVIIEGLYDLGFTDVVEVGYAAEKIARETDAYVQSSVQKPVISSACPVIIRLIERRFPALIDHVLPIMSPMELAARYIKQQYAKKGIPEEAVGVFFIAPCPGKVTDTYKPKGFERSYVDKVLSMQEVYQVLIKRIRSYTGEQIRRKPIPQGIAWAMRSGSQTSLKKANHIAVDGIESVVAILEKIEDATLRDIDYVEALACTGGCLGGALTIENPFVSCYTLEKMIANEPPLPEGTQTDEVLEAIDCKYEVSLQPKPVFLLSSDLEEAMSMIEAIEGLYEQLPGIDCGSCGAPTCKCFAEDVVKGFSQKEACVFLLRERIQVLSKELFALTQSKDMRDKEVSK